MIDTDSKQDILNEISEIRALLTRLQPVGQIQTNAEVTTGGGKRVLILF
jgi:hypothetical protein